MATEQEVCKSKCRYVSVPTMKDRKGWLRYYYCHLCEGYHLTSKGAKRAIKREMPKRPMVLRGGYWLEK